MSFSKLKGVNNIGQFGPTENIAENVVRFFDWGFINAGGYFNVNIPASSIYGGDKDQLILRSERGYTDGQIWEAGRKNWVWETGLNSSDQPISISGVYVDNAFYPKDTVGAYAHHYDYQNGRVIFSSAISAGSTVNLEYSYKYASVIDAYSIPFFQRIQQDGFAFTGDLAASGDMLLAGENRIQMPIVAIEIAPTQGSQGAELGSGARYVNHTVLCHVISPNPNINRRLADIIADQSDKTILMYNLNTVISSGVYPIDNRGMVIDNAMSYPQLASEYAWNKLRFTDANNNNAIQQINQDTYLSTTRLSTQTVLTMV